MVANFGMTIITLCHVIHCSLDLPFFNGVEKINDEYGETVNPENNFFKQKSRTLSFASWQNFASIENTTFRDLKCVHGPRQLHCVHSGQPESFAMPTRFSPESFSISSIIFNRSYEVLTTFCVMARLLTTKVNIDGSKLKVTCEAKRM
jgi:hypothetical protein